MQMQDDHQKLKIQEEKIERLSANIKELEKRNELQ